MVNFLKKYWAEILTFGGILAVLLICTAPAPTWMETDSDGIHYVYAAKYLFVSHKHSAPLFLLLGNLFLKIPFGTEFWRMALMLALSTVGASIFIYLIIRHFTGRKSYGCIGALVYGLSALVISQSTIVDTYALVTMAGLGAYYFAIKSQWKRSALMIGIGFAVHFLVALIAVVLFVAYKGLRPQFKNWRVKNWVPLAIICAFFLFYAYLPLSAAFNPQPNMWGNTTFSSFVSDNSSTGAMLMGVLSIWDFPKRILDTIGILGVCWALAIVPIVIYFWSIRKNGGWYKDPLLWLIMFPIVLYITNLAPQTYVYLLPTIAFGAIAAGLGLAKWRDKFYHLKYVVLGGVIMLGLFHCWYFDIGERLDPELSANKFYTEELPKLPDDAILVAQQGWEWAAVFPYNKENNIHIIPICVGTLLSPTLQQEMKDEGIEFYDYPNASLSDRPTLIARSILLFNDNVWITTSTDPETYGAEIIYGKGQEDLLTLSPKSIVSGERDLDWAWKPSNPYDIITGSIEVEEWTWIIFSNYNIRTFLELAVIGAVPAWILYMVFIKKRKWKMQNVKNKLVRSDAKGNA